MIRIHDTKDSMKYIKQVDGAWKFEIGNEYDYGELTPTGYNNVPKEYVERALKDIEKIIPLHWCDLDVYIVPMLLMTYNEISQRITGMIYLGRNWKGGIILGARYGNVSYSEVASTLIHELGHEIHYRYIDDAPFDFNDTNAYAELKRLAKIEKYKELDTIWRKRPSEILADTIRYYAGLQNPVFNHAPYEVFADLSPQKSAFDYMINLLPKKDGSSIEEPITPPIKEQPEKPVETPNETPKENPVSDVIKETMSKSDYENYLFYKQLYENAKKDGNKVATDYLEQTIKNLLNKYGIKDDNLFSDTPIENPPIPEQPKEPTPEPPKEEQPKPIETPSLPIDTKNIKLILDFGHGGTDSGCNSFGYLEKDLTLVIGKRVKELLKDFNPDVTRTTDKTLNPNDRTALIKDKYDYCISVHLNAGGGNGIEAIYSVHSTKGKKLAEFIVNSLKEATGLPLRNKPVFSRTQSNGKDYYYMHRDTGNTITVIVECLFLDNAENIKYLNVENIAQGIVKGWREYVKTLTTVSTPPVTEIPKVDEPKPEQPKEEPNKPQLLTYKRAITKGHTGEDVRQLQIALVYLGYDPKGIDGSCGNGCYAAIIQFQKDNGLVVDGWFGQASVLKINELLSGKTPPKYYKYGNAFVLEVNPLDLYIEIVKKTGNTISGDFINGSLFGTYQNNMVSISTLVSDGKILAEHLPHDTVKRGVFVVYKDGTVAVEMIDFISKFPRLKDIKFAIGGFNIMPVGKTIQQELKDEWFDWNQVGYKTWRSMLGFDSKKNKVLIVISPDTDAAEGQTLLKKLGCSIGVGLDSGGSTCGRFNNQLIRSTSRVLHNIVRW